MTTLGIEEEFMLIDRGTLRPVERAAEILAALALTEHGPNVSSEFYASQIEYASPVLSDAGEALRALTSFRRALSAIGASLGAIPASVGLPFDTFDDVHLVPVPRYLDIAEHVGAIAADHQLNGLHIHVGVPDRDAAIRAINYLRPWLPALLAVGGNSPFWRARDTGFDSWRAIHSRRWTTSGIPPHFRDAADYATRTSALLGIGGTTDIGTINWMARPSARYPTVEVRAFDAQLDAETSVGLGLLVRGLVASGPGEPLIATQELLDVSLWHAARYGIAGQLVDPRTGRVRAAGRVLAALLEAAESGLTAHGDLEQVASVIDQMLSRGNGAARQRAAYAAGGVEGLSAFLARSAAGGDS